jgi:hypothetical protein
MDSAEIVIHEIEYFRVKSKRAVAQIALLRWMVYCV